MQVRQCSADAQCHLQHHVLHTASTKYTYYQRTHWLRDWQFGPEHGHTPGTYTNETSMLPSASPELTFPILKAPDITTGGKQAKVMVSK